MRHPKTPHLCVDIILHTRRSEIILIERLNPPHGLALPGGFVDIGEDVWDAAKRETLEEVSVTTRFLEQFRAYGHPARDPRFHTCSIVFVGQAVGKPHAADDAKKIVLHNILNPLPTLQFDHGQILEDYLQMMYPSIQEKLV